MQVFIDAWLERNDPVLYIRACENGQVLFCLKGDDIKNLMRSKEIDGEDLLNGAPNIYQLRDVLI